MLLYSTTLIDEYGNELQALVTQFKNNSENRIKIEYKEDQTNDKG